MKGLLIKDIKLLANMRSSLVFILLIAVGMAAYMSDASFIVMYLGLIGTSFTSSTVSYDEYDNGYGFLFSLPVTRRDYAVEKYCFGLLMGGGGWLAGTVLSVASAVVKEGAAPLDAFMISLMLFPAVMIMLSVLLPLHMKFGAEKSRIVMMGAAGALFGLFAVAFKILDGMDLNLNAAWDRLPAFGMGAVIAGAAAAGIAILLLSCRISISIMEKKEF